MDLDGVMRWIAAIAAVGTAAMGLLEALKAPTFFGWSLATIGLGKVKRQLGKPAMAALALVYGEGGDTKLLEGAWRKGADDLAKTLRNGLRMAAFAEGGGTTRAGFITSFGQEAAQVIAAIELLRTGGAGVPTAELAAARERVARLEAVVDARVDAAVAAGRDSYVNWMQCLASAIALGGCLVMTIPNLLDAKLRPSFGAALLVGLLAVPIAPVAKDLTSFLASLRGSFAKGKASA